MKGEVWSKQPFEVGSTKGEVWSKQPFEVGSMKGEGWSKQPFKVRGEQPNTISHSFLTATSGHAGYTAGVFICPGLLAGENERSAKYEGWSMKWTALWEVNMWTGQWGKSDLASGESEVWRVKYEVNSPMGSEYVNRSMREIWKVRSMKCEVWSKQPFEVRRMKYAVFKYRYTVFTFALSSYGC
jgi:hypothetical protein